MSEEPSTGKIISNEVLQLTSKYLKPRTIMQRFFFEDDISDALIRAQPSQQFSIAICAG